MTRLRPVHPAFGSLSAERLWTSGWGERTITLTRGSQHLRTMDTPITSTRGVRIGIVRRIGLPRKRAYTLGRDRDPERRTAAQPT